MMADRVVIGDGKEVQALPDRQRREFVDRAIAVGVHRVRMQIPGQPAPSGLGGQLTSWGAVR